MQPIKLQLNELLTHVRRDGQCWRWTGTIMRSTGYAVVKREGKDYRVHRIVYLLAHGKIRRGLVVDHVRARGCRFRDCIRPAHLEAVTVAENCRRGDTGKWQSRRTHCPYGHRRTPANTYVIAGKHRCKPCDLRRSREYRRKLAA